MDYSAPPCFWCLWRFCHYCWMWFLQVITTEPIKNNNRNLMKSKLEFIFSLKAKCWLWLGVLSILRLGVSSASQQGGGVFCVACDFTAMQTLLVQPQARCFFWLRSWSSFFFSARVAEVWNREVSRNSSRVYADPTPDSRLPPLHPNLLRYPRSPLRRM